MSITDRLGGAAEFTPRPTIPIEHLPHVVEARIAATDDLSVPFFIHIAGASGAGKTSAARALEQLGRPVVSFPMDNYMLGRHFVNELQAADPASYGWDDVQNFDLGLIAEHLAILRETGQVTTPVFDRMTSEPAKTTLTISAEPGNIVVVEGIHALSPVLHHNAYITFFIDTPLHDRLWRRAVRNTLYPEFSSTNLDSLLSNYLLRVEPGFREHAWLHRQSADVWVLNPALPTRDYEYALDRAPDASPDATYTAILVPHSNVGSLQANEHIYLSHDLSAATDEARLNIHYVVGHKELLQHPLSASTLELLSDHYDVQPLAPIA